MSTKSMNIALVNTNRMKPPIAPIGVDYVAEALHAAGHEVSVLDLCWENDYRDAICHFFSNTSIALVGCTLRNTDDCSYANRESFINPFREIVSTIRENTDAPIVLGGVGFSVMPERILASTTADYGIWGDGEFAMQQLAGRIEKGEPCAGIENLVWRENGRLRRTDGGSRPLDSLPVFSRRWVDNKRYYAEGAQVGFETTRGCSGRCTYCADPVAKGHAVRLREPRAVAEELSNLYNQGVCHFHTCDSEFNLLPGHAEAVCRACIDKGLGEKIAWYAYCTPSPFTESLAALMRRAGCVGINFGADSADNTILRRLGRAHTYEDIVHADAACRRKGIAVMFDLLLGVPGETPQSISRTVTLMKETSAALIGATVGLRIYPGTALYEQKQRGMLATGLTGGDSLDAPLFFIEPSIRDTIFGILETAIGNDERFFFFNPENTEKNYNYNTNARLIDAIEKGYRGAYWDILRRYTEK
jgi:hypothetical protein